MHRIIFYYKIFLDFSKKKCSLCIGIMTTTSVPMTSLDPTLFGLFDNARQTANIIDSGRAIGDNIVNTTARELGRVHDNIERNAINTNQLLGKAESGIKDTVHQTSTTNLAATERTGATNITSLYQGNSALMNAIERNGGANSVATEKVGASILSGISDRAANLNEGIERVGTLNLSAIERNGGMLHSAIERMGGVNIAATQGLAMNMERNNGDAKLFAANQFNQVEKQAGDYFANSQRNFGLIDNNLLRVENSLGRLSDQHFASSQIELLKATALLDKGADKNTAELYKQSADSFAKTQLDMAKLELSLAKQAAENFASVQIENAKNRLGLEQKIVETGNDIKMNVIKETDSVKNLINERNTEYLRDNLQNEKIIHAMDHHYGHNHHDYYGHHHRHHHRRWDYDDAPNVVYDYRHNYNNDDRRGRRGDGGGDGGGRD